MHGRPSASRYGIRRRCAGVPCTRRWPWSILPRGLLIPLVGGNPRNRQFDL